MVSETPQSWLTEYLPPGSLLNTNPSSQKPAQEDNAMNKSVTSLWNMHKSPASATASPTPSGADTPLEASTPLNEELPIIPATSTPTPVPEQAATTTAETTKSKKRAKNQKDSASSKRPKSKKEWFRGRRRGNWILTLYYSYI